jgi:hypothetical protein
MTLFRCFKCGRPTRLGNLGMLMHPTEDRPHDCGEGWMQDHGYAPADSPLPASRSSDDIPSHVSEADIDWIEEEVGMGAGAWDMVAPDKIIAACWARLRAARATPPKGAEPEILTAANAHRSHGQTFGAVARPTRAEPNGK